MSDSDEFSVDDYGYSSAEDDLLSPEAPAQASTGARGDSGRLCDAPSISIGSMASVANARRASRSAKRSRSTGDGACFAAG